MKKSLILLILVSFFCIFQSSAQDKTQKKITVCVSEDEMKLYELIMEYRKEKGLPEIPLSKSLTYVARLHAKDVENNRPKVGCNMHSWSDDGKGLWDYCCYPSNHKNATCMWEKPRQLTNYPGDGFEIAHGGRDGYISTPELALKGWKNSSGHNAVIINEGKWESKKWQAIGVGIYKGFAMVWFGLEPDPEQGKPDICKKK